MGQSVYRPLNIIFATLKTLQSCLFFYHLQIFEFDYFFKMATSMLLLRLVLRILRTEIYGAQIFPDRFFRKLVLVQLLHDHFGVVYGISAFGLARNIGVSNAEAGKFIDNYFNQYPGVRTWIDRTIEDLK